MRVREFDVGLCLHQMFPVINLHFLAVGMRIQKPSIAHFMCLFFYVDYSPYFSFILPLPKLSINQTISIAFDTSKVLEHAGVCVCVYTM